MWSCGTVSFRAVLYEALYHAHCSKPMPDRAVSRTNLAPIFSRCACTGRWGRSKERKPNNSPSCRPAQGQGHSLRRCAALALGEIRSRRACGIRVVQAL
jgi:hypothetical protein